MEQLCLDDLPEDWVKLLNKQHSSPVEIALLCSGFRVDENIQEEFVGMLQGQANQLCYLREIQIPIKIFEDLSNHGFPFKLEHSYRHDSCQYKVEEMLWFLVSSQNTQGIPALLIERINQKYSKVYAIITKTDEAILENLLTWQHLKSKTIAAIDCFPQWENNQNELSQSVTIHEWLRDEIGANNFETDLIIKILSEKYT